MDNELCAVALIIFAIFAFIMAFYTMSLRTKRGLSPFAPSKELFDKMKGEKDKETNQRIEVKKCPECGAENKPDSKFCEECGAKMR